MSDKVDSMSDAQLRTALAEHGFPIVPVTSSTRKLLVKKLKLILDNKGKTSTKDNRKTLARYSSGEESDVEPVPIKKSQEKTPRRSVIKDNMPPPPPAASTTTRSYTSQRESPRKEPDNHIESDADKDVVQTHEEVETITKRRITKTFKPDTEYDTGSDSDVDVEKKISSSFRSVSRPTDFTVSTQPTFYEKRTSLLSPRTSITSDYKNNLSGTESLNSIRQRLGLSTPIPERPSMSTSYTPSTFRMSYNADRDVTDSPYLSDFSKKLSALKADAGRPSYSNSEIKNGRTYLSSVSRSEYTNQKAFNDKRIMSFILIGLVSLFFLFLFLVYIFKRNDITSLVDDKNNVIPLCYESVNRKQPGIDCIQKNQVDSAKGLFKLLQPELVTRTKANYCGDKSVLPYLYEKDIFEIANRKGIEIDLNQIPIDIYNLQVLLVNNPWWGMSVVELKNSYNEDNQIIPHNSMDSIYQLRRTGNERLGFALTNPSIPLSCTIVEFAQSIFFYIIILSIIGCLFLFGRKAIKYYVDYKKRKSDEIYSMVEQIIDIISQENEINGDQPYVSVNHVRDMLISPQERENLSPVWDAAVKFIQKNDSRVRLEIQSINGEECKVWRWIAPSSSSPRSKRMAWQGQAFETQAGSVNNLNVSPTPCLKIRHMIEKNDYNPNLRANIQDAILEKVQKPCKILHIDLDIATGVVYVKCATSADAGILYHSLHGWWYEGRLITVRYIHLDRYMMRFPHSPSSGTYLKASPQRNMDSF